MGSLQINKTLLFRPCLGGTNDLRLGWEEPLHGWSRGRVGGAAAPLVAIGLVPRVVDEAVGSWLTAVFDIHSQLGGVQRSVNVIHEHAQYVRVYIGEGDVEESKEIRELISDFDNSKYSGLICVDRNN